MSFMPPFKGIIHVMCVMAVIPRGDDEREYQNDGFVLCVSKKMPLNVGKTTRRRRQSIRTCRNSRLNDWQRLKMGQKVW